MFTGIVQGQATLAYKKNNNASSSFIFNFPSNTLKQIQKGASIAINGTCLTVTDYDIEKGTANFDAIEETLRLSNLGLLAIGDPVNFERAAKFGDEIGGHVMSGHIHSCLKIRKIEKTLENCRIYFELTNEIKPYILNKGFVGLNGCSLTIAEVTETYFSIHLIPETLHLTTFGKLSEKEVVNLEIDSQTQAIVDTVKRILSQKQD
tara:strand:+ start:12538 stop:13155 length:618 start_codon:yes stop_codon:yes gene_type:complete